MDLFVMARPERFELPTTWFEARYSIQLSYGRTVTEEYKGELRRVEEQSRASNRLERSDSGLEFGTARA